MRYVYRRLGLGIAISLGAVPARADDTTSPTSLPLGSPSYSAYLSFCAPDSTIRGAIEAQLNAKSSDFAALTEELQARLRAPVPLIIEQPASERTQLFIERYPSAEVAAERRMMTLPDFQKTLLEYAKLGLLVENTIGKGIKAEKRQLEEATNALRSVPQSQPLVVLEQLLFPIAPDEDSSKLDLLRAAASKAHQELSGPNGSFSQLATQYATSPYFARYQKLPALALDELTPELARALKDAKQGSLSVPVRSSYGFHLVRVLQLVQPEPEASEADISDEALVLKLRDTINRALKEISDRRR